MSGGSSGQNTQTTSVQLSPQQQQLLNMGMPFAQQYASNQPTLPSASSAIAGFNPTQQSGQQQALNAAAGAQQTTANNAANAGNFFTSGAVLDPSSNPALASAIQGAVLPARQQLQMQTLPGIRQQATGVGGMGNTREGVAEGIASGLESQGEQATAAQMQNQAYQAGLGAMERGLALAPQTQQTELAPAMTTSGVGDVQQALDQLMRSYTTEAGLFQQEQPMATAEALMGLGAGIPGGSVTSTGQTNQQISPLQYAMGGAGIGSALLGGNNPVIPGGFSGLGSMLGGAGTSLANLFAYL